MKFRSFIIVLLAVLMAFAFASCKQEPKEEPKPTPKPYSGDFYQIEVTEGVDKDYYNRDKIKLVWNVNVKEGDTISLKYRSERDVYQWDIRNGDHKWVYETDKNGFVDPVLGDDGWYTMTYTIGKTITGASGASSALGIYFRGNFVTTDIFEIKEIMLNDEELEVVPETITSAAQLNDPAEEFDWSVKNYAVLFATGKPGDVDKTPIAEKVIAGGKVTGAPIAKENYSLTIYTDTAHTTIFNPETPITEEKIFYYEYVGDPRTVTYVTNSTTVIEPVQVHYNDLLTPPDDPVLEGKAFKAWYKDQELTTKWDFLADHIEDNLTLYAGYGDPVTVTFDAQNGEAEHATATIAQGNAVAMPENPTNGTSLFTGWYTEAECTTAYNFAAPVEADITLYAGWVDAVNVTLNLNYEGAPEATVYKAPYGQALAENDENLAVEDDIIGMVYGGWYTEAACTNPYNYETVLTSDITLYAKWTEATLYKMVSKHATAESYDGYDKFAIDFAKSMKADDVLSFRYRSTTPITFYNVRNGSTKWIYQQPKDSALPACFEETKAEDGWTYVKYTVTAKNYDGSADIAEQPKFSLHFGAKTFVVGDILEVQDITLNGETLTLKTGEDEADGVVGTNTDTASIVEGGAYAWAKQTVTFNMGVADPIEPVEVAFGGKIEKPADPIKEGYVFVGWYADSEFKAEFNFDTPIIEATTIYAKLGEKKVVTFNVGEGATPIADVIVASGEKVVKPEDPKKTSYAFTGWNLGDEAYDFTSPVTEDITLVAQWVVAKMVTFDLNYADAPDATVVPVKPGEKVDQPKNPVKVGSYFNGWFTAAEGGEAVDFNAAVSEDKTVYAQWTDPTTYIKLTSTEEQKRFTVRYSLSVISPEKGDVIAFKYRPHDGTFKYVNIRNENSSDTTAFAKDTKIIDSGYSSAEADAKGWYTFYFEFPENYKSGATASYPYEGFIMEMIDSGKWQIGDSLDILGFSYNGEALEISSTDSTRGLYDNGSYAKPTYSTYNVSDDTIVE